MITQTFEPEQVADLPLGDRRTMRAPSIVNMDRGESLNAINHTNLSSPNAALGNPAFGQIIASRAARVMQIGMTLRF
jgi:hypothetical protein